MRTMLQRIGRAAPLAVVGLTLAACPGPERSAEAGGTVVVGVRTDFGGFNPITASDLYGLEIMRFGLFTPLVQYDGDLQPEPYLAESWELEGDSAVVFRLRQDVRWHDGQPVTAEDVKFTFDAAKDPDAAAFLGTTYLPHVHAATVVDPHTIRFAFTPHAQALESFWWAPAPRHLLEGVPAAELRNAPFNRQPVGSGPFRFVEWRANERLVLERNPDFPEALGGPPELDRVVFRVVPEPATMLTEVLTGRVHVSLIVAPEQIQRIDDAADVELHSFPGRALYFLGYNTRAAPFQDARVRRAMGLAVNRQEIIDALLFGRGRLASSPVPPWSPLHPDVQPLPHDPAAAGRLLDEAGWTLQEGQQVRVNARGEPLRFSLLTSDHPLNRQVVEVVQAQLRQIGVDAQIQTMEFQTLLARHRARDYQAVFSNWILDSFQVHQAPHSLLHSDFAEAEGTANRTGFAHPQADALIERGSRTTDRGEAQRIWGDLTRLLQQEHPHTFMFWLDQLAAVRDQVQNVEMDPRGELLNMSQWRAGGR
jgi:peptide/nickel transport system substrate-binding protein